MRSKIIKQEEQKDNTACNTYGWSNNIARSERENNVYKITKYCKNKSKWTSMKSLNDILKLIWAYLTICLEKNKVSHMPFIILWKATFHCNYCIFYSLFGNLFHLNMKPLLQWISQQTHKTTMKLHNRIAQDGLLLLLPVKLTKIHQAHLKWNLYNRQGPTNANGIV